MKTEVIEKEWAGKLSHKKTCNGCGRETVTIRTQNDNDPEYYTTVYIQCDYCGDWTQFDLPVN